MLPLLMPGASFRFAPAAAGAEMPPLPPPPYAAASRAMPPQLRRLPLPAAVLLFRRMPPLRQRHQLRVSFRRRDIATPFDAISRRFARLPPRV